MTAVPIPIKEASRKAAARGLEVAGTEGSIGTLPVRLQLVPRRREGALRARLQPNSTNLVREGLTASV